MMGMNPALRVHYLTNPPAAFDNNTDNSNDEYGGHNYMNYLGRFSRWNDETEHYDFGEPDWDEFTLMVRGEGEIPELRIGVRRSAHDEGAWVREAAAAYAAKQAGEDAA